MNEYRHRVLLVITTMLSLLVPPLLPAQTSGPGGMQRTTQTPLDLGFRAIAYPENANEWNLLNAPDIMILNDFGVSAEIATTNSAIQRLKGLGVTVRRLPKVEKLVLRERITNPLLEQLDPLTNPQIIAFPGESHPLFVSTSGVWQSSWTTELQGIGAQIIGHMPPYSALIHLPIDLLPDLEGLPFVLAVTYADPQDRLAPRLGTSNPADSFRAEILFFEGYSSSRIEALFGLTQVKQVAGRTILCGNVTLPMAQSIATFPEVEWIDDENPGGTYNEEMRVLVQTESSYPGANQAFYNPLYAKGIDGSTEIIAITDGGIHLSHETMLNPNPSPTGKVFLNYRPNGSGGTLGDEDGHGTAVAVSALGDVVGEFTTTYGTANKFDGLAYNSQLLMQDIGSSFDPVSLPTDWITELYVRAYGEGARVHNSSWGHGNSNDNPYDGTYSFRSQLIDRFLKDPNYYDSVQVFAVGNLGGDHNVVPPAVPPYRPNTLSDESHAKNAISVGGHRNGNDRNIMYTYSSRGPTNDGLSTGRIKPDLVSVGSTLRTGDSAGNSAYWTWFGTSHAAPCVSAASALIRDWFNKGHYTGPAIFGEPSSALIKAMLVNSTVFQADPSAFLGNAGTGLPTDGYPNFDQGYGRPVLDTVLDPQGYRTVKLFEDNSTYLQTGGRWTKHVRLRNQWPEAGCQSLRVTLAWTDEAMSLPAGKALVNDLDLQVTFLGEKYVGNFRHKQNGRFDGKNNVEDIIIPVEDWMDLPKKFRVQVDVLGTQVFSNLLQPFSVVVSFGTCPGTLPCDPSGGTGGCYPGPGDVIPTPNPPPNPCIDQDYTIDEFTGGTGDPLCEPGGGIIIVPGDPDPVDDEPEPVDGSGGSGGPGGPGGPGDAGGQTP